MHDFVTHSYAAGDTVYCEGMRGDTAYLIRSGRVSLTRQAGKEAIHLIDLGPGEMFGEFAILLDEPRITTATMSAPGDLIQIPKDRFLAQLDQAPPMIKAIFLEVVERLSRATHQLQPVGVHSPFLGVCRILALEKEKLEAEHAMSMPYFQAVRTIKDILQVSANEVEAVLEKLNDRGLIVCRRDDRPTTTLFFAQRTGFLASCERLHKQFEHDERKAVPDEYLELIDVPPVLRLHPEKLLELALAEDLPLGVFRVSRQGLERWLVRWPQLASAAGIQDLPEPRLAELESAPDEPTAERGWLSQLGDRLLSKLPEY